MTHARAALVALLAGATLAGCGTQVAQQPITVTAPVDRPTSSSSTTSPSTTSSSTSTASAPASTSPTSTAGAKGDASDPLRPGDRGPQVRRLQRDLTEAGYWNGRADGTYGHLTEQAVLALQKSAGLGRDGIAGRKTLDALASGTLPPLPKGAADRIEIDLERQVLLVVRGGSIRYVINTSTASGETYMSHGRPAVAVTPTGTFTVGRTHRGNEVAPLGTLYSPRYFYGGYAVHGAASIPGYPASHGCARVSNAAMDLIWSEDLMPVGSTVIVR
ncbi:L,D-transpeptidase family protein [Janibacter sp. G349]|uniref:L,D-transpeptidase family protein n=1 Tax=Janibacter sp. G349 TaxID=3405424 RepID=UPI003B77DA4A